MNNFPISAAGLGEGLNNAASALASADNSLEQSLAMLMAANATVQNPSKSSTATRTITARIRNTKAELDELGEELDEKYDTVAKYRKELLGLTGVDILDETGKNFRATYDILKDLADIWGTLTSAQQAAVTTMLAGTRNQDIFASLMKNFPDAEKALAGMDDAAGLMDEKFKAVEDSISGALSGLSNAWSKFSNTLLNSGDVVATVRALTSLVDTLSSVTNFTGGTGLVAIATTIGVMTHRAREFDQTWAQLSNTVSYVNVFGNAGDYASAASALNGYSEAQQRAILRSSQLTREQKQQIRSILASASGHKVLTSTLVEEAVVSEKVGLSEEKQAAVKSRLNAALIGTTALKDTDIITNLNLLVSEEQLTVQEAKLIAEQLGLRVALVNTTTAAGEQAVELRLLGNEYQSLGAKLKGFFSSENWAMLLVGLVITLISLSDQLKQRREQRVAEAIQDIKDLQQAARESINSTKASIDAIDSSGSSIEDYQSKLAALADTLDVARVGSDEYKVAKTELYTVQQDIISQFGEEAGAVREVSESLRDYSDRLDDVREKSIYNALLTGENYAGTAQALRLFGLNPEGHSVSPNVDVALDDTITLRDYVLGYIYPGASGNKNAKWVKGNGRFQSGSFVPNDLDSEIQGAIDRFFGEDLSKYIASYTTKGDYIDGSFWETYTDAGEKVGVSGQYEFNLNTVKLNGNILDLIDATEKRIEYFRNKSMPYEAEQMSLFLGELKSQTGFDEAKEIYEKWTSGYVKYSSNVSKEYQRAINLLDGASLAEVAGDFEDATKRTAEALALLQTAVDEADEEWVKEFLRGVIANVKSPSNMLKNDLRSAYSSGNNFIAYVEDDTTDRLLHLNRADLLSTNAEWIKSAGERATREEAVNDGLGKEYDLFQDLTTIASAYGVTLETVLGLLVDIYGLAPNVKSQRRIQFSTFHDLPSNYQDSYSFAGQTVLQDATGRVGAVASRAQNFWDLRSDWWGSTGRDRQTFSEFHADQLDEAWEASEEFVEKFNDYFGTSYEKITKDNAKVIEDVFSKESNAVYGIVEESVNDMISFLQGHEISLTDILGREDIGDLTTEDFGKIKNAILDVGAAAESAEEQAQAAAAASAADMASSFQALNGLTISVVQNEDGGFSLYVSGGFANIGGKKTRGGGGHHSQISDDIENIDRMIDLFRKLLNYYTEGSDQWIARQTQLIDKYKAGVEIAMNEYKRLRAKGLKETDEDVKKLVDTILEYQDDIYEESEKLWEAVRQNQIDSLKHLKDQNDAAIELEKTHHDLLIAIRDERRELEDELKAARDAYSEVMTPEELDAMFSVEDYAELMDKLAGIEGDAMALYRDYKEQIAAVSEDETYMIEHITDEFKRQYDLKMKEYEIAKAELGVARAQRELENVKNEQTVMMLIDGRWQWVADPEKVLEAEQALADAEQEIADAQDEYDFQSLIHEMEAQSSEIQRQIDALEALTFSMDDLAEQIHLFSDSVYKELLTYLSQIAQSIFDKYAGGTAVPAFAEGGVIKRGGLAMVHSGEPIFSTADAERLWRFVHDLGDTPINVSGVYAGLTRKLVDAESPKFGNSSSVSIDNSINIPGGIHVHGETAQQLIALLKEVVAPYQP